MRLLPKLAAGGLLLIVSCAALPQGSVPAFADVAPFEGAPMIAIPIDAVTVAVGTDITLLVARGNGSTTYLFEAGVHRLMRPIVPRDGDTFIGLPGAILSGAIPVTPSGSDGNYWYVDGLELDTRLHGECRDDSPRCSFRHDMFLDEALLRHVPNREQLGPGTWTYDSTSRRAYLFDDPAGRQLELSVARAAIEGFADDVTITGLVVERFANQAQSGAIMAERVTNQRQYGERWIVSHNEVRQNHGIGIRASAGSWIVGNYVHHNGQLGVSTLGPGRTRIEGNEIAFNNTAGYSEGWEAGGTKFIRTDGLIVRYNYVHHNNGPGLWTDIDNIRTLYEYNVVEHNTQSGIFHEISYDAVIRFNRVADNGVDLGVSRHAFVFGAGILISNSRNVLVYENVVTGNWNGIVGLQQNRGRGAHGAWVLRNLRVMGNQVSMQYHSDGLSGDGRRGVPAVSGVVQDQDFHEVFGEGYSNRFEANHYVVAGADVNHFAWGDSWITFDAWQRCSGVLEPWPGCRQDANGTLSLRGASE